MARTPLDDDEPNLRLEALQAKIAASRASGVSCRSIQDIMRAGDRIAASKPALVEIRSAFSRDLRAKARPERGEAVTKAFRDSLYDDE